MNRKLWLGARFSVLIVLVVLFLPFSVTGQALRSASPESLGFSTSRLERLDDVFENYARDSRMSGSVILVLRHGQIAYQRAFGYRDVDERVEMTPNTIFRIASQSKAIISVGVMILQEQGLLVVTDPVSRYLPEFESTTVAVPDENGGYDVVPANRKITIRDLLTHTSGVSYGGGPAADLWKEAGIQGWYFADRKEPIRETVRRMAALPFDSQPGEKFVYGYSIDILGALIEVVSGQPLDQFLSQELFEPLQMTDTYFYLPSDKADRLATVYSAEGTEGIVETPDVSEMIGQGEYVMGPRVSFSGGAGLLSTANDYARFLQMVLNGGVLGDHRILSRKSVELMTVNHIGDLDLSSGTKFGLGFSILGDTGPRGQLGSVGELGWGGAYHSTYWIDPAEQLVVAYFTQLIPTGGLDDHRKLRSLIYQAIVD